MPSLNTGNAILSNPIKVDSSYNVGIGGAASGSFKLQVTGTTNLTDNLTMTIASGTKSIGFGGNTIAAAANALIYSDTNYLVLNSKAGSPLYLNFDNANASSTINMFNGKFILTQTGAATFSSSVTALRYIANSQATYSSLTYEETFKYASSPAGIWFGNSFNSNNNVGLQLRTSNDGTGVQALTLSPTGAATFSSPSSIIANGQGIRVYSTDSQAADLGGGISLGGYYVGTSTTADFANIKSGKDNSTSGNYAGYLAFSTNAQATGNVERMRITSGGALQMSNNSTTFSIGSIAGVQRIQYGTGGFTTEFAFLQPNDGYTPIGASAFNTRSDYRLKEDLKEFDGLSLVANMKVYDFKWKEKDERNYGFMAHELQEVVPYVVTGTKDGIFEDEPQMQGLDYGKIVPVLVKAIQELNQTVQNQQQQINSLINR